MRVLVAMFVLFPLVAAAQNLGTYQITGGDLLAGANLGYLAGNGFTATIEGYPLPSYNQSAGIHAGEYDFSMAFSPPAGRDNGVYFTVPASSNLARNGLVPVYYSNFYPYIQESGEITTSLVDITKAGTYSMPFTMSVDVAYGAAGTSLPKGYVDFMGGGTVTVDVAPATCYGGACGPMHISSVDYSFARAPELDPGSVTSALMLLGGGILVLRGRRSRA
jgi:hypothetical protein